GRARRVARGRELRVLRYMALDTGLRDVRGLLLEVLHPGRDRFLVRAFLLVEVVPGAARAVAALARHARVRVAAEDRGVALHARALHVVGVGEPDRLCPARRLRRVELFQGVEVRLGLERRGLFLLPLLGLSFVVVAADALARTEVLLLGRGARGSDERTE